MQHLFILYLRIASGCLGAPAARDYAVGAHSLRRSVSGRYNARLQVTYLGCVTAESAD
jgi:hypothetical protein